MKAVRRPWIVPAIFRNGHAPHDEAAYWRDQAERMRVRAARLAAEADRLATEAADADRHRREPRLVGGDALRWPKNPGPALRVVPDGCEPTPTGSEVS